MANNTDKKALRVLVSGGGTGGHIFPALSIANEVRNRHKDAQILFVGAEDRMEMERVPAAGYKIIGLPVAGFDRKHLLRNFKVIAKLYKSLRIAKKVLAEFKPDICVGVGGYASGPMLKQAQKHGIPTLLQEQNSYAGVTNRMLAQGANVICTAYDNMDQFFPASKIIKTGNPVRADILSCSLTQAEAKKTLGFDPDKQLVLSIGGSLGARTLNNAIGAALPLFKENDVQVLWQTGKYYADECAQTAAQYDNVHAQAFISDMAVAYRAADLVVSRAGAGTISELQLLGAATILIPSPNVAEDHQRKNALALVEKDAAVMILDADAVTELGKTTTQLLVDSERREKMSKNIKEMALNNAAQKIVDELEKIVNNEH